MDEEKDQYSIDKLIETFERHAKQAQEDDKIMREKWQEECGIPYTREKFNIAYAFLTMVKEIKRLSDEN